MITCLMSCLLEDRFLAFIIPHDTMAIFTLEMNSIIVHLQLKSSKCIWIDSLLHSHSLCGHVVLLTTNCTLHDDTKNSCVADYR